MYKRKQMELTVDKSNLPIPLKPKGHIPQCTIDHIPQCTIDHIPQCTIDHNLQAHGCLKVFYSGIEYTEKDWVLLPPFVNGNVAL